MRWILELSDKQGRFKVLLAIMLCVFSLSGCGARELRKYEGAAGEPRPVSILKAGGKWPLPGVGSNDFVKSAGLVAAIQSPPIGGSLMGGALDLLGNLAERHAYSGSFILYFAPRVPDSSAEDTRLAMIRNVRRAIEAELNATGRSIPVWEPGVPVGMLEYRIHEGECDWETWFCMVRVWGHKVPAIGYSAPHDGGSAAWVGIIPISNGKGSSTGSKWKAAFPDLKFWRGVSSRLPEWSYIYLQPYKASEMVDGKYVFLQSPVMLSKGMKVAN